MADLKENDVLRSFDQERSGRENVYDRTCQFFLESVRAASAQQPLDLRRAGMFCEQILSSLKASPELIIRATDTSSAFSLTIHSVNVCILALRVSIHLEWGLPRLVRLGPAALFHDIGTVRLPPKLLFKEGKYTRQEYEEMKNRPRYGYELLRDMGPAYEPLAVIVFQAYERCDGSGYPRGLRAPEIAEEAQIIGLADVYEAYRHDRPHRAARTGYLFFEEYTSRKSGRFPEAYLRALMTCLSIYSVNEIVKLNTGEIGRVIETNEDRPLRPKVELLFGFKGERYAISRVIDLAHQPALFIKSALKPHAL